MCCEKVFLKLNIDKELTFICLFVPSHISYAFVVRVENKKHIVNIACWLQ